jgi:pyruvate, water dikinase
MPWIRWSRDVTLVDVGSVVERNASLGEMIRELVLLGVRVPDGFAVTADAYRALLRESRVEAFVKDQLAGLSPTEVDDFDAPVRTDPSPNHLCPDTCRHRG